MKLRNWEKGYWGIVNAITIVVLIYCYFTGTLPVPQIIPLIYVAVILIGWLFWISVKLNIFLLNEQNRKDDE